MSAVTEDRVGVEARPEDPQDERAQVREEVGGVPVVVVVDIRLILLAD